MIGLKDQMGREVSLKKLPQRIISLVPSQTEFLYALGLEDKVVGITKFCIHPKKWHVSKSRIGGTKNIDHEKVKVLNPDLIIGNMEENTKDDIEFLTKDFPVYMSDVLTIGSAYEMMVDIGKLVGEETKARAMVEQIEEDFKSIPVFRGNIYYFMWKSPLMVAGKATFIGQIIALLGFNNLYNESNGRYREITDKEIKESNANLCLLSTEPFPFKQEDIALFKSQFGKKAIIVDGEMFSWYGARMLKMKDYLVGLPMVNV